VGGKTSASKEDMAIIVGSRITGEHLRLILKQIIICDQTCGTQCPIYSIEKNLIKPLRNVDNLWERSARVSNQPNQLVLAEYNTKSNNEETIAKTKSPTS
jgi:hypothetical protein